MINQPYIYTKFITTDANGKYDCTENPHLILAATIPGLGSNPYIVFNPQVGTPSWINWSASPYYELYTKVYNDWVQFMNNGLQIQTPSLNWPGSYSADSPPFGSGTVLPLNITNPGGSQNIVGGSIGYLPTKPPFEMVENLSANQYIAPYLYDSTEIGLLNGYFIVQFIDVTGKYSQFA